MQRRDAPAAALTGRRASDIVGYLLSSTADLEMRPIEEPASRIGPSEIIRLHASLSDRGVALLRSLSLLHYATTAHIRRLHFAHGYQSQRAATLATQRCLARLHELRLVERLARRVGGIWPGSAPFLWRLSSAGLRLVGDTAHRSRRPGLAHLAHELSVAELVVRLHEARKARRFDILAVQTQPACWRQYGRGRRKRVLKPDLRLTIGLAEVELHWFVEIDRANEHRSTLERKLRAHEDSWRFGGERAATGVSPRVLWVVPNEARADLLRELFATVHDSPSGLFLACHFDAAIDVLTAA